MPPLLNKKLLDELIAEHYGSQKNFCKAMGISENTPINWAKRQTVSDKIIDDIVKNFIGLGVDVTANNFDLNASKIDGDKYNACMAEVQKIAERCGYPTDGNSLAKWATLIYQSGSHADEHQVKMIETFFNDNNNKNGTKNG